jgi:quinol monooxygenase YgiN
MKNLKLAFASVLFLTFTINGCGSQVDFNQKAEILNQPAPDVVAMHNRNVGENPSGYYSTGILKIKDKTNIDKTIEALKELKENTIKEPGYVSFIVQQDKTDPTRILIWEHFKDEASFKSHLGSPHLNKFLGLNLVEFVIGYSTQFIA